MKKALIVFIISAIFAGFAKGDILAGWEVTGIDMADGTGIDEGVSPYTFTATTFGANVTNAKLSLGNVSVSTSQDVYGLKLLSEDGESSSLSESISNNHYLEFNIVASDDYEINLQSIEMHGEGTSTSPNNVALLSSIGGFSETQSIATLSGVDGSPAGDMDTDSDGWGGPIDLSGSDFQGLTETTTFRLYMWNASGSGSTRIRSLSGDDLIINGTTETIPEPTTFALISLLSGLAFFRGRLFMK